MARLSAPLRPSPPLRWRWLLPVAVLVGLFHFLPIGRDLDHLWLDLAGRHPLRTPPLPANSALVLVDEATMADLGRIGVRWPFQRRYFAQLALALHQAGAARVVLDFTFFEESAFAEQDLLFGAVATAATSVVLARTRERAPFCWPEKFQREHAPYFPRPRMGLANYPSDPDGVVRRYGVTGSLAEAAGTAPAAATGGLLRWHGGLEELRRRGVPVLSAARYIRLGGPVLERIAVAAPDLDVAGVAAALAKEAPLAGPEAEAVRGRVVFVGANAQGTYDLKTLPVGQEEPGLLVHWTAWANLAGGGFATALPRRAALLVAVLGAAAVVVAGRKRTSLRAPVTVAAGLAVAAGLGSYGALAAGWFLSPATLLLALLLTLLGVVAESFWLEQRRKREIQSMFGAYVAPAVVERLVRDPEAIRLRGERREATVFFSDLAGFTDLSEKLRDQPERMVEVVNAYLEETSECVLNHGAYVDKYIGDAVMAVFGVPQPLPDHAVAACRAALEAQRLLAGINARYAAAVGVTLAVRIGLNTGELIVGNLGSARKMNYTVMGDTVNLASRLEGANKHFGTGILLGPETARRVQGEFATRPLARLRVKGKEEAVDVHALHGRLGELVADERAFLQAYGEGYAALVAHRFADAAAAFTRAKGLRPGDLTTERWRHEALTRSRQPTPTDWQPLLALDSK
jgi:adenylate cyclase